MRFLLAVLLILAGVGAIYAAVADDEAVAAKDVIVWTDSNGNPLPAPAGVENLPCPAGPPHEPTSPPYDECYAKAQAENKPLLVLVGAPWCGACKTIHKYVPVMRERGVFCYVDVDKEKVLVERLKLPVKTIPVLVVYEHKGAIGTVLRDATKIAAWAKRPKTTVVVQQEK